MTDRIELSRAKWRRPWSRPVLSLFALRDRNVRRRVGVAGLLCFAVAVAAAAAAKGLRKAPKIEPPFESIIEEGAGPVREFALRDHRGALHTMASWSTHRAIVLLFCKTADRDSMEARRATAKLAAFFQQRGVLFLAVCCDGTTATAAAHDLASEVQSALPILFDPQQVVARQAGARVVPEAVLLSPDGQVLYRGRVQAARGVPEALQERRWLLRSGIGTSRDRS